MSEEERRQVLDAYVGARGNRRHKPGRAFERTSYRFDILGDYGAFRDLQRHRLLTLEWQRLSPAHGFVMPEAMAEAGGQEDWQRVMDESAATWEAIAGAGLPDVAAYAVSMAYRVRFTMQMNAREAMHVIELRTTPQGHPAYRRICQTMHRLIAERAGHRAIAAAMRFADHSEVALERLEAERAAEQRRRSSTGDSWPCSWRRSASSRRGAPPRRPRARGSVRRRSQGLDGGNDLLALMGTPGRGDRRGAPTISPAFRGPPCGTARAPDAAGPRRADPPPRC